MAARAPLQTSHTHRRSYAERADEIAALINDICQLRSDPDRWHQAKNAAAVAARRLAAALRADGL